MGRGCPREPASSDYRQAPPGQPLERVTRGYPREPVMWDHRRERARPGYPQGVARYPQERLTPDQPLALPGRPQERVTRRCQPEGASLDYPERPPLGYLG
jgi:hypothetical protein